MTLLSSIALSLALGCGGATPPVATPTQASDVAPAGTAPSNEEDESMAELKDHHRHHHHGGFVMFIAMSLDSLGTTPEQSAAIHKIQSDLHAKMQPAHDAEKNLLSMLADGIAAGNLKQAAVDDAIAKVRAAAALVHDAASASLNELHATLTPPQRAALVGKVEAHFNVWHHENSEESTDRDAVGGHLGRLAKELGLSSDQVDKIRASVEHSTGKVSSRFDSAEATAHLKAFGAAFASDSFDAKSFTAGGPANAHIAAWGAEHMARFYAAVLPALTPDQRTKLADSLRRHANYKRTQSET
jgi:Spy/CpxP family protein refolding chaperone